MRAWAFFPGHFRPLVALLLSMAFLACLLLAELNSEDRPAAGVVFCSWMSVTGFMLLKNPFVEAGAVLLLGIVLSLTTLEGKGRLTGLGLTLLAAVAAGLQTLGPVWGGITLGSLALLEWKFVHSLKEPPLPKKVADLRPRAEIFWRGFAQLYAACASGEGEKYSRQVLDHTTQVIRSCGGTLESGSEHRGIYLFESGVAREQCFEALQSYGRQMNQSLESADVPEVKLTFRQI